MHPTISLFRSRCALSAFRRMFAMVLGLMALVAWTASQAQPAAYPTKPVRLVVPFTPGGITDVGARLIGRKLSEQLGQPVVVDNRAGAGGNLGAELVAKAEPDGYTMLFGTQGTQVANQYLYKAIGFDPARDFIPVHEVFAVPNVIVTSDASIRTLNDLVARAKENPGSLAYASPGNGTGSHLTAEMFQQVAGIKLMHVPYRGSSPAITDLLAGSVPVAFDFPVGTQPHILAGKLRALAVTGPTRVPALPDVPTLREAGFADAESTSWTGVFVPRGTPPAVVSRLTTAMDEVMADPETIEGILKISAMPMKFNGSNFSNFVQTERVRWREVVTKSRASVD